MLVIGDRAERVADAYQAAGAPPIAYARPGLAFLAKSPPDADFEAARAAATGLEDASLDLVALRHAWVSAAGLEAAVAEAHRVLAPGGALVLAEPDLTRLLTSQVARYPSQILYRMHPEIAAALAATLVSPGELGAEVVRAGFVRVAAIDVEDSIGTFSPPEYLRFLAERGWPASAPLSDAEIAGVVDAVDGLLPKLAPIGPIVEREPWRLVRAVKRG